MFASTLLLDIMFGTGCWLKCLNRRGPLYSPMLYLLALQIKDINRFLKQQLFKFLLLRESKNACIRTAGVDGGLLPPYPTANNEGLRPSKLPETRDFEAKWYLELVRDDFLLPYIACSTS